MKLGHYNDDGVKFEHCNVCDRAVPVVIGHSACVVAHVDNVGQPCTDMSTMFYSNGGKEDYTRNAHAMNARLDFITLGEYERRNLEEMEL